jgi:8-oxo-dGTP pyrophosphatase MutT (NUDIX family)
LKLEPWIESQVVQLAARYGEPLRWDVELENDGLFDPLGKPDRYGEVCMVVRRPNGKLITATKTFYPPGAFRLLTGGIHHGEKILDALLRETEEETGLTVEVRRFLAVVSYRMPVKKPARPTSFTTFAFLLDETGGTLQCLDAGERLGEFREIAVEELPALAGYLDALAAEPSAEIHGKWHDWGRFRAVIHRAVYEALTGGPQ